MVFCAVSWSVTFDGVRTTELAAVTVISPTPPPMAFLPPPMAFLPPPIAFFPPPMAFFPPPMAFFPLAQKSLAVAPIWRRSMLPQSLKPSRFFSILPSKFVSWPADHVIELAEPCTGYMISAGNRGVPSQWLEAGLPTRGLFGEYHFVDKGLT